MKTIRLALWAGVVMLLQLGNALGIGGVDTPPAPSAPHEIHFPQPKDIKLTNGLRLIVAERHGLPLLAAQMLILNGAEVDPLGRAGATELTASLLTKGTDSMSAPEIANVIESLGGIIYSGGGWDNSSAGIAVMSDKAEPAFKVFADVVRHPAFKAEELERLRKQKLDGLRVEMEEPGVIADYARVHLVFPRGEYAHPYSGTIKSLATITRDDVITLYHNWFRPDNAVLILVGDLSFEQAKTYAEKYFGDWKATKPKIKRESLAAEKNWKPRQIVIDMPQAGQAAVLLAKPSLKRASLDYYTGLVANTTLGNGFSSRLNREIRIKRGLSYGASSVLGTRRDAGQFIASVQTKNESAAEVASLVRTELKDLATRPVEGEELRSCQALLSGGYARGMETNFGVAGQIGDLATYGLPLSDLQKYIPAVNKVTGRDIASFAQKYLAPSPGLIVVGKASLFVDSLKKEWSDIQIVNQSDLDLNRTDLVKSK